MLPRRCGMKLRLLAALLLLPVISGCSLLNRQPPEPEVVIQTKFVENKIPLQVAPKPVSLNHPKIYVVTEENWDEFIETYKKDNGQEWVFYAFSVRSYETLALNIGEIRRYMEQQKAIIAYYEGAIERKPQEEETEIKD
jgi:hypothetical protein